MKYVIQLTVTMIADHSAEYDYEQSRFFFEEHHCHDNLIDQLYREMEQADGLCSSCYRSEVKMLREASAEDIDKYGLISPAGDAAVTP